MAKKYYWLKLQKDFFKQHYIRIVESMPNGKDYVLFYLKLLVESISHEGELRFSDTIPYNENMLATITNTNIDIVRSAMDILQELGLIDILEDSTIYMAEVNKMIGSETDSARWMRDKRTRDKLITASHCEEDVEKCDTEKEKEKEKEEEQEKEKEHKRRVAVVYYPNDEVLNEAFKSYVEMRKKIKSPMTDRAIELAIKKLENLSGGDNDLAVEIINQSVMNSWKGLFELSGTKQKSSGIDWSNL